MTPVCKRISATMREVKDVETEIAKALLGVAIQVPAVALTVGGCIVLVRMMLNHLAQERRELIDFIRGEVLEALRHR